MTENSPERADVPEWMREIREAYIESLQGRLDEIMKRLAAAEGDHAKAEELESSLHRLHGSAGSYGFDELGELAGACEELVNLRRKRSSISDATFEELRHEIGKIEDAVEKIVNRK